MTNAFVRLANTPIWKVVVAVVLIVGMAGTVIALKLTLGAPGGEKTREVAVDPKPIELPKSDHRLDVFRADWNIRGRFEAWPALLPLAKMSRVAYDLELAVGQQYQDLGFDDVAVITSPFHSQVAHVITGEDVAVIVFRGTDDTEDWFSNANLYLRQMPEGQIHTGFSEAYSTLRPQILEQLDKSKAKYAWITGHSLGGAMALVCAYDLSAYHPTELKGVITFGQPMIAKGKLIEFLQQKLGEIYVHFVNELDAVPQVPLGFSHCGCMLRFYRGKIQKSDTYFEAVYGSAPTAPFPADDGYEKVKELPVISPQRFEEFRRTYDGDKAPPEAVMTAPGAVGAPPPRAPRSMAPVAWKEDHSMDHYIEKIEAAIEKATGP